MKTLGIIGGLGPMATAYFMELVTVEGGGGSVSCNPVCYSTLFLQGALPANRSANYFSVGKNR